MMAAPRRPDMILTGTAFVVALSALPALGATPATGVTGPGSVAGITSTGAASAPLEPADAIESIAGNVRIAGGM